MARVKRGVSVKRRHKAILKRTKGYRGARRTSVKRSHEAVLHAGEYAFMGRKLKKRDIRRLWISRISQATKQLGIPYKDFIHQLTMKKIALNRKMLADLVGTDFETFKKVVEKAKSHDS